VAAPKNSESSGLKEGLVGGFLANAMPAWHVPRFLNISPFDAQSPQSLLQAKSKKMGKSRNFNRTPALSGEAVI
jgi:hypothetical protein